MSILFFEGFETIGTELGIANQASVRPRLDLRMPNSATNSGIPTADSVFLIDDTYSEGYALQMGQDSFSSSNYLQWDVETMQAPGAAFDPYIIGCLVHIPITTRSSDIVEVRGTFGDSGDGTGTETDVLHFGFVDSTDLIITRGNPGAFTLDTVLNVFTPGAWHYVEFRFLIAETVDGGIVEAWVDDTLVSSTTGDTNNSMTTAATKIRFHNTVGTTTTDDFVGYDDIYIVWEGASPHTARLGATRVRSLPPTSNVVGEFSGVTETTLATTLSGAAETQVDVGTGNIPADQPATGTLKVELDTGPFFTIAYTSHDSDGIFTTASTDWSNPADATSGNDVHILSGENWSLVDENGADSADYVETNVTNKRDRYSITNLTETGNVWAVKLEIEAINVEGGDPSLFLEVKSGATVDSTEFTVDDQANYEVFSVLFEQDPNTAADWLNADVDSMTAGFLFDNKVS